MIYHDPTGQLYLHLPLVPTLIVFVIIIVLIKIKIFSIGLRQQCQQNGMELSENENLNGIEPDNIDDDRVPYEPKLHSNNQVRHIDL